MTSPGDPGASPRAEPSAPGAPEAPAARTSGPLPSSGDPDRCRFICPRCRRAGGMSDEGDGLSWCADCNVGWTDEDWD